MRALAEYVMRGRSQAASLSVVTAALPLLFWLSASIISLVTLRRGRDEALLLLGLAALPALVWLLYGGDPRPVITVGGTVLLAGILRITVSWVHTLAVAVGVGILSGWIFEVTLPGIVADMVKLSLAIIEEARPQLATEFDQMELWAERGCVGILGAWQVTLMLCCLLLARWWQSVLYNPGGFREEFHRLRLPAGMALGLFTLMFLFMALDNPYLAGWIPVLSVPLLIACIGLVHWSAARARLGNNWLILFYILLLFLLQVFYPLLLLLALIDSCFDLRRRLAGSASPPAE